jgi:hypothetical protein
MFTFPAGAVVVDLSDRDITGFYYDPDSGEMIPKYDDLKPNEITDYLRLEGATEEVRGNTTYYRKNGKILKTIREYTWGGKTYYYYSDYFYHDNGQIKQRSRTFTTADGKVWFSYNQFYYDNGNRASYDYAYYDRNTGVKRYDFQGNYNKKGQITDRSYTSYDSSGNVRYSYDSNYFYNDKDQLSEASSVSRNSAGEVIRTTNSQYSYYDNGNRKSISSVSKNGDGNKTWEYNLSYNSSGRITSYNGTSYNPDTGETRYTYEVNYSYDQQGRINGYTYVMKDGQGNIIRQYNWSR